MFNLIHTNLVLLLFLHYCTAASEEKKLFTKNISFTTVINTTITIPTVNYFPHLTYPLPYNMPHLNVSKVNYTDIINVTHNCVVLENNYLRVVRSGIFTF